MGHQLCAYWPKLPETQMRSQEYMKNKFLKVYFVCAFTNDNPLLKNIY